MAEVSERACGIERVLSSFRLLSRLPFSMIYAGFDPARAFGKAVYENVIVPAVMRVFLKSQYPN